MKRFVASIVAAAVLTPVSEAAQRSAPNEMSASTRALQEKARTIGRVRVIVRLAVDVGAPGSNGAGPSDAEIAARVRDVGRSVAADRLGPGRDVSYMSYTPIFVVSADADEIGRLAADPRVASVQEDALARP